MKTKQQLETEMEDTRRQFHQLLNSLPDEAFGQPSSNPAWNIGELLYHMSIAPRLMVADVAIILKRPLLLKLLPKLFPERLFHWLNAHLTRFGARHLDRQFLADAYNKAHERILQTLHSLNETNLQKSVHYPDWDPLLAGGVTVAYLFGYIKRHFDSHAADIQQSAAQTKSKLRQNMTKIDERKPVTGLKRFLFRAPLFLYRIGLGGLLGTRFLLLNHTGRKSGQLRQTVLEVVKHDKATGTYTIASGFGKKSDWYLNILAQPKVEIQVGWRKLGVTAVPLTPEQSGEAMVDYARQHPTAAKNLGRVIGYDVSTEAEYRKVGHHAIPFVALEPR